MARRLELSFENGQEPWGRAGQGGAAAKLPHRLGLAIGCLGLWFLSHLTAQSTHVDIVWRLVVTGLGQGLFQPPNNNAIMSSVPAHRVGIAAGFLATVRVLGQASSVALSGAVFAMLGGAQAGVALSHNWGGQVRPVFENIFTQAFGAALLASMAVASLGVLTSLLRGQAPPAAGSP